MEWLSSAVSTLAEAVTTHWPTAFFATLAAYYFLKSFVRGVRARYWRERAEASPRRESAIELLVAFADGCKKVLYYGYCEICGKQLDNNLAVKAYVEGAVALLSTVGAKNAVATLRQHNSDVLPAVFGDVAEKLGKDDHPTRPHAPTTLPLARSVMGDSLGVPDR